MGSKLFKSKTINFAALLAVLSVVELNTGALKPLLSENALGYVTLGISAIVAYLRVVTTGSIEDK